MRAASWVLRGTVTVPVRKRIETPNPLGGIPHVSHVEDGTKSAEVVLEVDGDGILGELGRKALRSSGKRSQALGGWVKVRVVGPVTRQGGAA